MGESVADLFGLQVSAEVVMRDYYTGLAEKFSHLPEISAFWKSMAEDETRHIARLNSTRESLPSKVLSSPAEPSMVDKVKRYLGLQAAAMLNSAKTLDDAYQLAHEIEHSEFNGVFVFLNTGVAGSDERKKFIMTIIETHLERLMSFAERFGDSKLRKNIPVRGYRKRR